MLALRFAVILGIIACSTSSRCSSATCNIDTSAKTIKCSANCTIECIGNSKCSHWTIQCTDGSVCNLICNGYACQYVTINATNTRTLFVSEEASYYALWHANIFCPQNGDCNIKCDDTSCQYTTIHATDAKSLFISLLSNNINDLSLSQATINCPSRSEMVHVPEILSCGDTRLSYLCSNTYRWKLNTSSLYDITYSTCSSSIDTRIYVSNESHNLISDNSCGNG
eukprot:131934_1